MALAVPSIAQSNSPSNASLNSLNVPPGQGILARLITPLDSAGLKPGDAVLAETTRDLKRGHDMLLKKGSVLTGHVVKVQAFSSSAAPSSVAILFDQVSPKGGSAESLNVQIQALAPQTSVSTDSLQDGRGMAQTNINSAVSGSKNLGNGGELIPASEGVYGIRGMTLASTQDNGKLYSIIESTDGDVKLKKNTQIVFIVPEQ